jgi:hypothetical protein
MKLQQQRLKEIAENGKRTVEPSSSLRYPSARYFQIHFEHVYELLADLKQQLDETQAQIAVLKRERDISSGTPDADGF